MKDREFLKWIHARLRFVHGEDVYADHMHRLRSIIYATPDNKETPIDHCFHRFADFEDADKISQIYKRELSKGEF